MATGCFEGDDWRAWLSVAIFAWPGEPVDVYRLLIKLPENRKPRIQILAKNVMLRGRVGLNRPEHVFLTSHEFIKTNTMVLVARHFYGYELSNRVDGRDLEPGDRVRQDQPRMQALLRGTTLASLAGDGKPELP